MAPIVAGQLRELVARERLVDGHDLVDAHHDEIGLTRAPQRFTSGIDFSLDIRPWDGGRRRHDLGRLVRWSSAHVRLADDDLVERSSGDLAARDLVLLAPVARHAHDADHTSRATDALDEL